MQHPPSPLSKILNDEPALATMRQVAVIDQHHTLGVQPRIRRYDFSQMVLLRGSWVCKIEVPAIEVQKIDGAIKPGEKLHRI